MNPTPLKYRPEIDGLRAIAILAVVFYHADLGFPGGFVGVDIFFVISGYLITSIVLQDLEAGTFSLLAFWERRARRILPALVVVAGAVLGAGWFLLLPDDFRGLASSAISLSVFGANFYFWRTVDYFSGPAEELPLLHTWSLALEEQFYLLVPFLLLLGQRLAKSHRRRMLGAVLGGGFVASLAGSIWMLAAAPGATFYLLPGRAWELLAGSLLALLPTRAVLASRIWREIFSCAGLAGIVAAVFFYDDETPFPGAAALLPCLGAALVIFANGPRARGQPEPANLTATGWLLSRPPVVAVGLISYSLYLWHWPIFAFVRYYEFGEMALSVRWTGVGVAFGLAALSWWCVETPFRVKRLGRTRGGMFALAGAGLVAILIVGIVIDRRDGIPRRISATARHFADAQREKAVVDDKKLADIRADNLTVIGVKPAKASVDLLIWGDSHARASLPAWDALCTAHHLSGRAVVYSATFPLLNHYQTSDFGLNAEAIPYAEAVLEHVRREKIPNVVLIARWDAEEDRNPGALTKALPPTIAALRAAGANVFILLQVPSHPVNVPRALALDSMVNGDASKWLGTPARHRKMHAEMNRLAERLAGPGCVFLDPAPAFATTDGRHYKAAQDGNALYRDKHHLTRFGALTVLAPFLEQTAAPRLKSNASPPEDEKKE